MMVNFSSISDGGQTFPCFDVFGVDPLREEFFGAGVFHSDVKDFIGGVEVKSDDMMLTVDCEALGFSFFLDSTHLWSKLMIMNDGS